MKRLFPTLFTVMFTTVSASFADLKYSFVDLDYTYTDYDNSNVDGGHGARATVNVSPFSNFFVTGGIAMSKADAEIEKWDVETTRLHLGVGGYVEMVESLHLVGEAGVVYSEANTSLRSIERDELGAYAKPGLRVWALETLELNASMTFSTIENEEFMVGLGAGLDVIENLQLNGGVDFSDESNIYSAGLRIQW